MKPIRAITTLIAASGLALLLPSAGFAQTPEELEDMTPEQRREYVQGLSDEQRQALREQSRARWDAMSEEEREAARRKQAERRAANKEAMRKQWDSMSGEEREAARAQRKAQKERQREIWNNMSDEEKAVARERARANRDGQRQDGRGGQRKGGDEQGSRQQ
jgi:hypothetical protein